MSLATAYDVLEETGAKYDDFGFSDVTTFNYWIDKKIDQVDIKIQSMVGSYYTDENSLDDLRQAEIDWVYYKMLRRKLSNLAASVESGFALGSLRIDSTAGPTERLTEITNSYFTKARIILERYTSLTGCKFVIAEDIDE